MAVKFLKLHLNEKNVTAYEDFLKKIRMPFIMEVSNYTTKIISEGYNIHFMRQEQSNRTFAGYAKIVKDLKGKEIPDIDMERNCYYDTSFKGDAFYSDRVYNIDMKSAYCTLLFNAGYITKETYDYINRMPKKERLACLGMLASRRDIFQHSANGSVIKLKEYINPLSNFFFYCVQKTEDIIQSCKNQILLESFLFSWVDGIYYLNHNPNYQKITQQHLKRDFKMDSTFQVLTEFEVKMRKEYYNITYKNEKGKPKVINILLPETKLKKQLINHLLTKKYDK